VTAKQSEARRGARLPPVGTAAPHGRGDNEDNRCISGGRLYYNDNYDDEDDSREAGANDARSGHRR
jgi:hypothetical protein